MIHKLNSPNLCSKVNYLIWSSVETIKNSKRNQANQKVKFNYGMNNSLKFVRKNKPCFLRKKRLVK